MAYIKIECTIKDMDGNVLDSGITPRFWQTNSTSTAAVWTEASYPQNYYSNVKQYWKVGGDVDEDYEFDRVEIGASNGTIDIASTSLPYESVDVSPIMGSSSSRAGTLLVTYYLVPPGGGGGGGGDNPADALLYGPHDALEFSQTSERLLCGSRQDE